MATKKSGEKRWRQYGVHEPTQRCENPENRLECRPGFGIMRRDNNSYTFV
ncbi:MAG: hypothetical protein OEW48_13225 [Phycisphaerae bacterium]|nr:hypothetical protein [Phycisphaerae bacterium]